jgi:acylphosphatase
MIRSALIMAGLILLTVGCSSTPKVVAKKPQYCHTSSEHKLKDGSVASSEVVVECTDDDIKRLFQVKSGMSPYCGEFRYWTKMGGQDVQRKGISCQRPDGSWEIVNTNPY